MDVDRKAVDFGAGTGNLVLPLLDKVCGHVTAVDVSDGMLKYLSLKLKAKGLEHKVRLVNAELEAEDIVEDESKMTNRTLLKGSYDIVLCSMVIHHMKDRLDTIKMFKSMLKQNGILILYEFEASGPETSEEIKSKKDSHGVFHDGLTPMTCLDLMTDAGLKTLHSKHAFSFGFQDMKANVMAVVSQKVSSSKL